MTPGSKEKFMKTFYCVMTEFYDDGTVKAAMVSRAWQAPPQKFLPEALHNGYLH
jgi:hypothetical protein